MPTYTDTLTTAEGRCPITIATPDGQGTWPAVVMYPDAGGARQVFTDMAQQLATLGYVVVVPDVYYRRGNWAPFDMGTVFSDSSERQRLFAMMGAITPELMEADARALFDYLAAREDVSGEAFGTTGYCMGGRTSLIVAGRVAERVVAAMSFHGGRLATDDSGSPHRLADRIRAVVYVGAAENDGSFPPAQAELLATSLTDAGVEHAIEWYPAAHGFAVPDNAPYDEAAAERHWMATAAFFGRHLPG
jgi:carboxymethylenebutenolidase